VFLKNNNLIFVLKAPKNYISGKKRLDAVANVVQVPINTEKGEISYYLYFIRSK
jgi:hypothetical protein